MSERIILDPAELAGDRAELDITDWLTPDGVDWGAAEIEPYYADGGAVGRVVIDYRIPNRQVVAPMRLQPRGGTAFATIRSLVQAKVAEFQDRGGWVKRVTTSGGTLFADVHSAGLTLSGDWGQAHRDHDVGAEIRFERSPDFYGDWIELDAMLGSAQIVGVLPEDGRDAVIRGDFPLGNRCRITLADASGNNQRGAFCAVRCRNYDAAATARLLYEAEDMTPMDIATATRTPMAGFRGTGGIVHTAVGSQWTPLFNTDLVGVGHLTHTGSYRVLLKCRALGGPELLLRLAWDVGDLTNPTTNSLVSLPIYSQTASGSYVLDLGQITIDRSPVGTHQWIGVVQACTNGVGTRTVHVDCMYLLPLDEFSVFAMAPISVAQGMEPWVARDEFGQATGGGTVALNGLTLPVGGRWITSGATTDFFVEDTFDTCQRTTTADTATRFAVSTIVNAGAIAVTTQVACYGAADNAAIGSAAVIARYGDSSNYVYAAVSWPGDRANVQQVVEVVKKVAGAGTFLARVNVNFQLNMNYRLILMALDDGTWAAWWLTSGATPGNPIACGTDADLASGGALARGSVGIWDWNRSAVARTRVYSDFGAWAPQADYVAYGGQGMELSTEGFYRADADGIGAGPIAHAVGRVPRLPSSGPVELIAKHSLGTFDNRLPDAIDSNVNGLRATVYYRPCWLGVAE
jgi:hypothetical protein